MDHDDGDSQPPPFWYPPPTNPRRRPPRMNPVALTLILSILALLAFYLLVPTNQIFLRPFSVKRTWDSLNILLLLFALLCGLFARRNDDPPPPENRSLTFDSGLHESSPSHSVPAWLDFPDRKDYNNGTDNIAGDISSAAVRLTRSSSSYPDLRHESISVSGGRNPARYFDDFEVDNYRFHTPSESFDSRRLTAERGEVEIPDDKFEVQSPPPPKSSTPPPPPPSPPPPAATSRRRRSVHSVPRRENAERRRDEAEVNIVSESRRPIPPPAPPPPQPELRSPVEETSENLRRKKSVGAAKEIGTAIASTYRDQRKRKKRGIKIRNVHESAAHNSDPIPQSAPPPPPPPPPPSKLLQNLFKKSSKSKRVHSVPTGAPPPPPPPPPNSIFVNLFKSKRFQPSSSTSAPPPPPPPPPPTSLILNSLFKKGSINSRRFIKALTSPPPPPPLPPPRQRQVSSGKPPKPFKQAPTRPEEDDTKVFMAPPSPLIPLPPPPPPPQFGMSKAKFVAQGDFVRIRSSPELEDVDFDLSAKPDVGIGPSISCPSPDVNEKADTFIARLRDEWRLEKVNSVNEKRASG